MLSEKQQKTLFYLESETFKNVEDVFFGGCFRHGTLVCCKRGYVPIQEVAVGDVVLSYNTNLKIKEWKKVVNTFSHNTSGQQKTLITFNSDNYSITSTDNHEFYLEGNWVSARTIARRIMEVRSGFGQ